MPLSSNLFAGDKKLEACQISDAAHITVGAKGDHVAKIQIAIRAVDRLDIASGELDAELYGPSTAAAVLKFKAKRNIINRAYQQTADNIVGKMTITRLDEEIRRFEVTHRRLGDCACSPAGVPGGDPFAIRQGFAATPASGIVGAPTGRIPQRGGVLRIYCSITRKAALETGYPLSKHLEKAKDTLFEHGIALSVEFKQGFADTIAFPDLVVPDDDVPLLRKASEDARAGFPEILRIIVCTRSPNAPPGETFRNIVVGGKLFKPFAVLNSRALNPDNATLLHEMIHAANAGPIPHDGEPASIFFDPGSGRGNGIERTFLKPDHALTLSKSFFHI